MAAPDRVGTASKHLQARPG